MVRHSRHSVDSLRISLKPISAHFFVVSLWFMLPVGFRSSVLIFDKKLIFIPHPTTINDHATRIAYYCRSLRFNRFHAGVSAGGEKICSLTSYTVHASPYSTNHYYNVIRMLRIHLEPGCVQCTHGVYNETMRFFSWVVVDGWKGVAGATN